ncbi:MAG: ankyrin repeat domain-containing protein [Gammaproteobacteria bacterium]|nr:ankyrin repeat domain-containing protein [Gammaproteobacteria bacterium]
MHYSAVTNERRGQHRWMLRSLFGACLFLGACVAPRVLEYTSFHKHDFPARTEPAKIQTTAAADLLKNGYLLIGYIDLRRNLRTCYEDNQCENHSDISPAHDELQREAAQRGGDVLTLLEDRTVIEPRNKSYCSSTTTTVVTIDNMPRTITICASTHNVAGKLEAKISRALIWRYDPEAARGEANAQAIDTALKTIEASYRADETKAAGGGSFLANLFPNSNKKTKPPTAETDVLGEQILLGIRNNDVRLLYALARDGKLQKWKDEKNRSALMVAILAERLEAARTLLAIEPGIERRDDNGLSALHYAVARADVGLLKEMVKAGYDLRRKTGQAPPLLYFSPWNPKMEVFEWLRQQGLDARERTADNESLLQVTADAGNETLLRRVLELDPEINLQDKHDITALMAAADKARLGAVQILLQAHSRTDLRDKNGNTVLHHAAIGGKRDVLQIFLQQGLDLNALNEKGASPLIVAIATDKWDAARYLIDRGAALVTAKLAAEDIAQLLISKNQPQLLQRYLTAYPTLKELVQRDPDWLQYAAKTSGRETIRYLADLGARLNRSGSDGLTPLMTASVAGNSDAVRALIELKADATLRDAANQTALKKATLKGQAKVVETLRELGVKE